MTETKIFIMTRKKSGTSSSKKSKADSTEAQLFAPITSKKTKHSETPATNIEKTLSCPPIRCLLRFCIANDHVNICCNCKKPSSLMCPCVDINIVEQTSSFDVTYKPTFFCIHCLPASKFRLNQKSDHLTIHGILFAIPTERYEHPVASISKLTKDDFVIISSLDWKSKIVSLLSEKIWNCSTPGPPDFSCRFNVSHDDVIKKAQITSCGANCRICFKPYKSSLAEIFTKVQTVRQHYDASLVRDMIKQPLLVESILNEQQLPHPLMTKELAIFRFGLDILNKNKPDFVVVDLMITASGNISFGSLLCSQECMECEAKLIQSGAHSQIDCIVYDMFPYVLMTHIQSSFKDLSLSTHLRQSINCSFCKKTINRRKQFPCSHCEFAVYCSADHRFKHHQQHVAMCRSKSDQFIFLKNV